MKRIFIGIDLPTNIKKQLHTLIGGVPGARWLEEDNYHITLRFIGNMVEYEYDDIADTLEDLSFEPFSISIQGLGIYETKSTPHTLYVGIKQNENLQRLKLKIDRLLHETHDLPLDQRNFSPHITIAKLKKPDTTKLIQYLTWHHNFSAPEFLVHQYHIYESHLSKNGSIYDILDTYDVRVS